MNAFAVILAVFTLFAGAAAGWFAAQARGGEAASAARSERDVARSERSIALAELVNVKAERDGAQAAMRLAELQAAEANSRIEALQDAQEQLKATFSQLSTAALEKSNETFLTLADAKFKQAGAPLTETLDKVERQMRAIELARTQAQATLTEQISVVRQTGESLKHETASLVSALRKPQARGRWGEMQLRRLVELAGMTNQCDFDEQVTVTTADGPLRPDMVIRLVGGKSIVVDSKVTLAAFLDAYESTDDAVREEHLVRHAKHLRKHVDDLGAKSYWSQFSAAPEFVVLFVPGDAILAAALDHDANLLDDAFAKRVHIATPTTLISTLRTCAYAWQQDALAANARDVFDLGRELYKRLATVGSHFDKLGRSLTGSVKAYNETVGSFERNVLSAARKLNDLDIVDYDIDMAGGVEETVRPLTAPELLEQGKLKVSPAKKTTALPPASGLNEEIDESYGVTIGMFDEAEDAV